MKKVSLGIICLARKTFDYMQAHRMYFEYVETLKKRLQDVELIVVHALVIEIDEAVSAVQRFASERVDGVVIISGTLKTKAYLEHCKVGHVWGMCG